MTVWREPAVARERGPVLFLDRDGVVVVERDYLSDPALVTLVPGAAEAMARAHAAGYALAGVSNQSGIGRGLFTSDDFAAVMTRIDELLAAVGVAFDGFYYCPHGPDEGCICRKPRPGLLDEAAARLPFDPARSWLVGDKESDIRLARSADLGAVLVRTGHGSDEEAAVARAWRNDPLVLVADDLPAAVAALISASGKADS